MSVSEPQPTSVPKLSADLEDERPRHYLAEELAQEDGCGWIDDDGDDDIEPGDAHWDPTR